MLPVTDRSVDVRNDRLDVTCKDEHLAAVLRGEAFLVFDGAMGTMLQQAGLQAGDLPELMCLDAPETVTGIHRAYVDAGAQAITTNTFGANRLKLEGKASVNDVFEAAVKCARDADAPYVAADLGPTGELLQPLGELTFDEAYELFAEQARAAQEAGADLVIIETMADLAEMKAAVLAAKENSSLPIFATMTFGENGRTFLGCDPTSAACTLDALGVNVLGVNCSLGPAELGPVMEQILANASCPVIAQPNAGLPEMVDGVATYTITAQAFAEAVDALVAMGVTVVGGCCGTNPEFTEQLARLVADKETVRKGARQVQTVTCATKAMSLAGFDGVTATDEAGFVDGEVLINALGGGELEDVVDEAMDLADDGCSAIVLDARGWNGDDTTVLERIVHSVQGMVRLPLVLACENTAALERAVRSYAGKPGIVLCGSDETRKEQMLTAIHYGCAVFE